MEKEISLKVEMPEDLQEELLKWSSNPQTRIVDEMEYLKFKNRRNELKKLFDISPGPWVGVRECNTFAVFDADTNFVGQCDEGWSKEDFSLILAAYDMLELLISLAAKDNIDDSLKLEINRIFGKINNKQ